MSTSKEDEAQKYKNTKATIKKFIQKKQVVILWKNHQMP
jgi:hypothetical protein